MHKDKKYKWFLTIVFGLTTIGTLGSIFYLVLFAFMGAGWGGEEITLWQPLWKLKGIILIFLLALIASIGIPLNKKAGIVAGFSVLLGSALYIITMTVLFLFSDWGFWEIVLETLIGIGFLLIPLLLLFILAKYNRSQHIISNKSLYISGLILSGILLLTMYTTYHS